jgi:hypothetical protein
MAIIAAYPQASTYLGNPAVDVARRENLRRDIIEPPMPTERNAAEKGLNAEERRSNAFSNPTYADEIKARNTELRQAIQSQSEQSTEQDAEQSSSNPEQNSQSFSEPESAPTETSGETKDPALAAAPPGVDSPEELAELTELKQRDTEVRTHEQAHVAMGGQYASAPSYQFERGPDGQPYAVEGEVQIDVSTIPGDPAATISKMQQVIRAALAPAEPSAADRQVANEAAQQIADAKAQQALQLAAERQSSVAEPAASSGRAENINMNPLLKRGQASNDADNNIASRASVDSQVSPALATAAKAQPDTIGGVPFVGNEKKALTLEAVMEQRNSVIQRRYQTATEPQQRSLLQTA